VSNPDGTSRKAGRSRRRSGRGDDPAADPQAAGGRTGTDVDDVQAGAVPEHARQDGVDGTPADRDGTDGIDTPSQRTRRRARHLDRGDRGEAAGQSDGESVDGSDRRSADQARPAETPDPDAGQSERDMQPVGARAPGGPRAGGQYGGQQQPGPQQPGLQRPGQQSGPQQSGQQQAPGIPPGGQRPFPQPPIAAPNQLTRPGAPPAGPQSGAQPGAGREAMIADRQTARGHRRARLQLRHLDPWSALKFSLVLAVAFFVIWMVAIGVLYGVLDQLNVFDKLNHTINEVNDTSSDLITPKIVLGAAAVVGAINIVLFTALATIGSFVYNLCADMVGGIEVTLAEGD
jgi:hypothetical protein